MMQFYSGPLMHFLSGVDNHMSETRIAGQLTDDEARGVYVEMVRVAERDLTGDALIARLDEIRAMAEARGGDLAPDDPRTEAQQQFDGMVRDRVTVYGHNIGRPWQPPSTSGFPSVVTPGDVALYRGAPADGAEPDQDALQAVDAWLRTAAAPKQAAELLKFAKGNGLVLQSLLGYATIANAYHRDRPK